MGERRFTDGAVRHVFEDPDGRQFVLNGDGDKVFGVWIAAEETKPDCRRAIVSMSAILS